ncbi:MAG: insulinase family protein [Acidobacteriota bacterium]
MRRLILPPIALLLTSLFLTSVFGMAAGPALADAGAASTDDVLAVGEHRFHRRTLDNGLVALAATDGAKAGDETISIFLAVDAGNRYETAETTGLAHLVEHALYTGTERTAANAHDARIAELDGESNATTRDDTILVYDHRIPASALDEVLSMEADRLRGLTFDEAAVLHERDRLEDEEARTYTRGMARNAALEAAVFTVHPYRFGELEAGSDETLHTHGPTLDVATIRAFYDAHYHPNRVVVAVAGAVDPTMALDAITRAFGHLPAGPEAPTLPTEPTPEAPRTVRLPSTLAADRVEAVWVGPAMGEADRVALHALARWLGRQTLADGTPVEASMGGRRDRDLVRVAATGPEATAGLARWLDRVRTEPLPAADVDLVKDLLRDDFAGLDMRARPYFSLAAEMALHAVVGHVDWPGRWAALVDQVDADTILAAAGRHLDPSRRTTVIFEGTGEPPAPLPEETPALRQAAIDATEAGDLDRAVRAYSRLLDRKPNRMNTVIYLATRGQIRMQQQAYDGAIRDFEDALQVVDYPAVRDLLTEARRLQSGGGLREEVVESSAEEAAESSAETPEGDATDSETSSATASTEPAAETSPASVQDELDAQMTELRREIEAWRGLTFTAEVEVEVDSDADPNLAGWYEPETDRMVVTDKKTATFRRGTLLHELVHALQDQRFDLVALRDTVHDTDGVEALTALIEGEAMLAVTEIMGYDFEAHAEIADTGAVEEDRYQKIFQYGDGLRFVRALRDRGGWAAVDEAWRQPPKTTAEILHPERYPAEPSATIERSVDGEVVADERRGENRLRWLLTEDESTRPAAGRMAALVVTDRYREVRKDGATVEVWDLRFASSTDVRRFERYAGGWLQDDGWRLEADDELLRLTR